MGLLDRDPFANNPNVPRPPSPAETAESRLLAALDQLQAAIAELAQHRVPAPEVIVEPPDLSAIVQAVTGLKPGVDADGIAEAIVRELRPSATGNEDGVAATLAEITEALKALDFRMKGVGTQAFGGGSVSLSDTGIAQLTSAFESAVNATVEVTAVAVTATAASETTVHTPAAGQAIRLHWVSAINDPDASNNPLVQVKLGSTELYRAYAVAHRQVFEGAADEALTVTLDQTGSVAVTAHLVEFSP